MANNSERLSRRERQPGHDQTFRKSETRFIEALRKFLAPDLWKVEDHPRDLARMIGNRYGVVPEASITYIPTGRKMYFEVKKQGPIGNAEERACKHHTVQFYKALQDVTGYDYHAFITVMCENLATDERYRIKHPYFFEPDQYFEWINYDEESLRTFIDRIADKWLKQ